jgi:hypothetical protein
MLRERSHVYRGSRNCTVIAAWIRAEALVLDQAKLLALRIPSEQRLKAAVARSRTQAPRAADPVTQCGLQLGKSEESGIKDFATRKGADETKPTGGVH